MIEEETKEEIVEIGSMMIANKEEMKENLKNAREVDQETNLKGIEVSGRMISKEGIKIDRGKIEETEVQVEVSKKAIAKRLRRKMKAKE